eukprot:TRINITY_DN32_c0_g1_i3.p2 TRINITY_DN32_c0_g1~~TRINITY_DN32_c0_g1_i3.p2  ORF type:complete len:251 (+),score=75.45 TRINITY_DN32_c0_g1_i3:390-1142(+)
MLYASTQATVRSSLGDTFFVETIFGSVPEDFSPEGYRSHLRHKEADVPLTDQEVLLKEEREMGVFVGGGGTSSAYVHGVQFPIDDAVTQAFSDLSSGNNNYVQLTIDVDNEIVLLSDSGNINIPDLPGKVPNDEPRFHFFNWTHDHKGEKHTALVFVYSCPDGSGGTVSAPVKMRMLFSSSKANIGTLPSTVGMEIGAKLEINNGGEFNEDELTSIVHPPEPEEKKKIVRPKGPRGRGRGRGGRRLVGRK